MTNVFDAVFGAFMAWHQIALLAGGLILLGIGGLLLAWFVHVRMTGRKVKARLVAVRMTQGRKSGGVDAPPGGEAPAPDPSWASFAREARKSPGSSLAALLVGLLLVGVPVLFVGLGAWFTHDYLSLVAGGVETQGTVVRNDLERDSDSSTWHAIVSFEDSTGRLREVRDRVGKGGSPFYDKGQQVVVRYDPADPERVAIGGFWHNLTLPVIFVALGGGFLFLLFVLPNLKKRSPPSERPARVSYGGEMYYPVFEYVAANGETVRAEGNGGSNWLANKLPGTEVVGFVRDDDPETVERPGLSTAFFALLFGMPGVALVWLALTAYELNVFSLVIAAAFLAWAGSRIGRHIKPRAEWDTKASFRERRMEKRRQKRALGRLLTAEAIRDRLAAMDRQLRWWTPVVLLAAGGLIVAGLYLGQDLQVFLAGAERASGRVVRLDSVYRSAPDGSGYTYYPVVQFSTRSGERIEFRDRVGSNPPSHRAGDTVDVAYDPARPQVAMVDRGWWNWVAPGGCLLGGLLLLWLAVKYWVALRSRARPEWRGEAA